jgi:hypothetical protein
MLERMYLRWASAQGLSAQAIERSPGAPPVAHPWWRDRLAAVRPMLCDAGRQALPGCPAAGLGAWVSRRPGACRRAGARAGRATRFLAGLGTLRSARRSAP